MVSEWRDAGDAHEWLRRARSNFARAAADPAHPDILLEDLCFDAQQAAEKAIKAVLVHRRIRFPKHMRSRIFSRWRRRTAFKFRPMCWSPRT
jgi:HEPN domain-containing protein